MSEVIPKPLPNRRLSLCDQRGRPAVLLEAEVLGTRLNRLVIGDAIQQPHDLDPAPVKARLNAVDLATRIVAILRFPELASLWIDGDAESIANAVGKHFLDVGAHLAAHCGPGLKEGIILWRRAVVIEAPDHSGGPGNRRAASWGDLCARHF